MILREVNRVGEGKKNVPKLRFKGYEDAWEQRKLGDIADRFDNLRVPISAADRIPGETPYYGANGIQDYVDGYTHDGEFLLVAEDGANDLEDYPVNYVNGKIWVNNHAHVIQSKSDISINSFLMYAIKQIKMNQFIVGGSRAKLNSEVMISLPITIPDIKEQLFIGDYFQGIDNLITLHQRKYDALKTMKKTLLSKMFPKDGEEVPEIRFKGFTDAWEQRKLGEVFEQTVEYVNPKLENIELWSVTVESGLTPKTERYNREALVKKEDKFKLVHPGDVVYNPMNMTIGAVGMNQHSDSIAVSGYYVTMRLRENFNGFYFFEWLSSDRAMNLFRNHATGSLIEKQRVQFPTLSNIGTYVPAFLEQKNIGHFFQRLDKLITLHQRKLDELKNMKKTLLQQMFV